MKEQTRVNLTAAGVYLAAMAVVVATLLLSRGRILRDMDNDQTRRDWKHWQENAVDDGKSSPNPVQRRRPKSDEPPALVLMRDHFATVMCGGILFSSLVVGAFLFFLRGAMARPEEQGDSTESKQ